MPTFGTTPGVQIDSTSGEVQGVSVGREMWLILVGNGDNAAGSANVNTVEEIESRSDAESLFGADTDLVEAYQRARAGGANSDYIKGIMTENTDQSESFSGASSGTLANTPIIPDTSRITVDDTGNGDNDINVEFTFNSTPLNAPSSEGVRINPHTGDWAANESSDYDFDYDTADWSTASDQLDNAVRANEFGLVHPLTSYEGIVSDFRDSMLVSNSGTRDDYKMLMGAYAVQYNSSTTSDYAPRVDTSSYSNSFDSDISFLLGPAAVESFAYDDPLFGVGNSPYYAGAMVGTDITSSVFNERIINADPLDQKLSPSKISDLRDQYVIPMGDKGVVRFKDNQSTYDQASNGGYTRDWFTMRVHDVVVATVQELGQRSLGLINNSETRGELATQISGFLTDLEELGVLVQGGQQVQVTKHQSNDDEIVVDMAFQPQGVTKAITVNLVVQP